MPEVVRDFFVQAGPLVGVRPVVDAHDADVFSLGRVSREVEVAGNSQESRFGRIGREYKRITFQKGALKDHPDVEWVTPGHALFEAGQGHARKPFAHPLDDFLVYMFVGVIIGGFVSGAMDRRVALGTIKGPHTSNAKRILLAIGGGVVSAFGARLARGCTSGLALTGGATLAVGSWVFMLAVFAGGYGLAYFLRKEWL